MSSNDLVTKLAAAVKRHVGAPGTIHDFQQLTGGANKTTWSFDADVEGARLQLILQVSSVPPPSDEPNPLAEISAAPGAEGDARVMIAARKVGVPAPVI